MINVAQLYLNDKDRQIRWSQVKEDFWDDLKRETMIAVRKLLTTSMEIQVQDLIGISKGKHYAQRPTSRNGFRYRNLISSFGYINNIKVPRVRTGKIKFNCLPYYKQRTKDVDTMVMEMFLAGVSTRRIHEVIEPMTGPRSISAASVSTITKSLNKHVNKFRQRKLTDDYVYLICDGVYLNVKNPIWKKRRCVLVVYGIKSNGKREIIDFQLASQGESQLAWEKFLWRLYYRGLEGKSLRLIVRDGSKALRNALSNVFPFVDQQLCWAHKIRNVANKVPKSLHDQCINQARDIYNSSDYYSALKTFKAWAKFWNKFAPDAVKCLNDDIDDLLNFFKEPKNLWRKLRTTNAIERSFREVRRRTRPISCFQNSDSVQRIIFAIFYRLNKNWENKPIKFSLDKIEITHNS